MRLAPIGHDERLSIVDHLDELRTRLFASAIVLAIVFALCFWQNNRLINLMNRALPKTANSQLTNVDKANAVLDRTLKRLSVGATELQQGLAASHGLAAGTVAGARAIAQAAGTAAREYPKAVASERAKPLTIGVGESFTATLTVAGYFALLITLPFLLYQLYAFVLPAMHPHERRVALPAMIAAPLLFAAGVVFTFFEILPPAIHFLQGYNNNEFYVLVQGASLYKFEVLLMAALGLTFQLPLLLLALQRVGMISASTLTLNWRIAIVIIAVVGAALPGSDPVSMVLETAPLVGLYGASVVLLRAVEYRDRRRTANLPPDNAV